MTTAGVEPVQIPPPPARQPLRVSTAPFCALLALLFIVALAYFPLSHQWKYTVEEYKSLLQMRDSVEELRKAPNLSSEPSLIRLQAVLAEMNLPKSSDGNAAEALEFERFMETMQPFWVGLIGAIGVLGHLVIVRRLDTVPFWEIVVDLELGALTAAAVTIVFFEFEHMHSKTAEIYGPVQYLMAAWVGYSYREVVDVLFKKLRDMFGHTVPNIGRGNTS